MNAQLCETVHMPKYWKMLQIHIWALVPVCRGRATTPSLFTYVHKCKNNTKKTIIDMF